MKITKSAIGRFLPSAFALVGIAAVAVTQQRVYPELPNYQAKPPATIGNPDNSSYSGSFKFQYQTWKSTDEMKANTRYGGSGFRDYLAAAPNLVILWAGYAFSKEYNQARGHSYAMHDVKATGRRNEATPATCYSCKGPNVPVAMNRDGVKAFYANKFDHYVNEMGSSIGCADCHEPKTMKLQISRPALIEGYMAMGKDINKVPEEEKASLTCAQCHVEYHFKGADKYLKFPWNFGQTAEDFARYYNTIGFSDWTHTISGAKMVKMQHPDFELFKQGLHGKRGVSCADCHMPKETINGKEITNHQIQSPLYMADKTCGNCHAWSADEAKKRVYEIQDRTRDLLTRAERILTRAHLEIGDAKKLGATDAELESVRMQISMAQMYWDYVAAANSMGFHAPQESARVLGKSIDMAQECRIETQEIRMKKGATGPLVMPDISTKQKAQAYIKQFAPAPK